MPPSSPPLPHPLPDHTHCRPPSVKSAASSASSLRPAHSLQRIRSLISHPRFLEPCMNEIPHAFQCLRGVGDGGGGGAGGLRGGVGGGYLVFSCKPPSLSLLFFPSLLLSFVGLFFFFFCRRRRGQGEEGRGGFIASQIEEIYCFDPCAPLSG